MVKDSSYTLIQLIPFQCLQFFHWYIIFFLIICISYFFKWPSWLNEWLSVSAAIQALIMPNAEGIALSGSALGMKTKWMAAWRASKPKGLNARCIHKGGWLPPHCENNSFIISGLQWVARRRGRVLRLTTKVTDNCRWNVESANWTHSATINCLRIPYPIAVATATTPPLLPRCQMLSRGQGWGKDVIPTRQGLSVMGAAGCSPGTQ